MTAPREARLGLVADDVTDSSFRRVQATRDTISMPLRQETDFRRAAAERQLLYADAARK
jgi:hypothetical protein